LTEGDRSGGGTDARRFVLPTLLLVAITLLLYGDPVPRLSEELYLPLVRRTADAEYLWGDWTFSGAFHEHWLFDQVFAPVAGAMSVSMFGWVGRLVFWPVLALLLIRIGNCFGLKPWPAAIAVALWLVSNQSLIGGEWILGTFEAKTVAYVCFLGALLAVCSRRIPIALALLGLTMSFHPAVGLWAAWGMGISLLALRETRRAALRWSWLALLFAVPGIISALSAIGEAAPDVQRFVVLEAIPHHTDPFFGGVTMPEAQAAVRVGVLLAMFAFNLWAYRRSARDLTQRFFFAFQIAAFIPFAIAFPARAFHLWDYLRVMPLRSFPLIVPLVFFIQGVRWALPVATPEGTNRRQRQRQRRQGRRRVALGFIALVVLAVFPTSPLIAAPRMVKRNFEAWTNVDDMKEAFHWIRDNTPPSTTCIFPVDRQDSFVHAERPQVANWQAIPYDRLDEWKTRIDHLVGGRRYFAGDEWHGSLPDLRDAYDGLTLRQVNRIAARYDATCFVTESTYPLQLTHTAGDVHVYAITPH
jgi:hypothetical protein